MRHRPLCLGGLIEKHQLGQFVTVEDCNDAQLDALPSRSIDLVFAPYVVYR